VVHSTGMDVINISFGTQEPSVVLAKRARHAYHSWITAMAAAGNDATYVAYPAALPTVIGVGAIGRWERSCLTAATH
jgi:subtilisin